MRTAVYDIGTIRVPEGHRALDEDTVASLMQSISEFGLIHPIVVEVSLGEGGILLVAGRHRLEACRRLGHTLIEAVNIYSLLTEDDPEEARLVRPIIEIQENLYRLDTTARKRAEKRLLTAQEALSRYRATRAAKAEQKEPKQSKPTEPTADNIGTTCPKNGGRVTKLSRKQRERPGSSRGRPRNAAKDEVAKKAGVSRRSLNRDLKSEPPPPVNEPEPATSEEPQIRHADSLDREAEHALQEGVYEKCLELWRTFEKRAEFLDAYRGLNSQRRATFWKYGAESDQ